MVLATQPYNRSLPKDKEQLTQKLTGDPLTQGYRCSLVFSI